jgi:hypothetical protein
MSSVEDTESTKSDGKHDSELDSDVDMRMEEDVNALQAIDLDGDVDVRRDIEDEADEEEENGQEEDEKEQQEEEDEDEDQDEDEDNGKDPWTIGQGEMVNILTDNTDTMVDDQPTMLPEQGQEIRKHTPQPQPLAPAPWSQTPEARP